MRHELSDIGHTPENKQIQIKGKIPNSEDFVLEKGIFNNIFEKDIRRVFIYKKAERLAKAIHLIAPAFSDSVSLRNRIDSIAIGLVDGAVLSSSAVRSSISRELLSLSSMLSIARTGGFLSPMNADTITREAHILLQEVADYEDPRILLDETPTLATIAKNVISHDALRNTDHKEFKRTSAPNKGHILSRTNPPPIVKDRRETIMSVIKDKKKASIKDISTLIRGVSEKTIQRELSALISSGIVLKEGERRWSTYSLA